MFAALLVLAVPITLVVQLVYELVRGGWRRRAALAAMGRLGPVSHRHERVARQMVDVYEVLVPREGARVAVQLRGSQIRLATALVANAGPGRVLQQLPFLVLRREDAIDRLAKAVHLNREVESGAPDFDRRVYIESDAVSADIAAIVRRPALRDATLALFERGATAIETARDRTPLHALFPACGPLLAPGGLDGAVDELLAFARAFPAVREPELPARARGQYLALASVFIGFGLTLPAAAASTAYPVLDGALLGLTLALGAVIWLAVSALVLRWLRGRPRTLRYLGWTSMAWLVNGPLIASAILPVLNGAGAQEIRRRRATVEQHEVRRQSKSRYITVTPWPPHRRPLELRVDPRTHAQAEVGAQVEVLTSPGLLGHEWLRGVELPRSGDG